MRLLRNFIISIKMDYSQARYIFDTLAIVSWESNRLSMPKWNVDTDTIASEYEKEQEEDDGQRKNLKKRLYQI